LQEPSGITSGGTPAP